MSGFNNVCLALGALALSLWAPADRIRRPLFFAALLGTLWLACGAELALFVVAGALIASDAVR